METEKKTAIRRFLKLRHIGRLLRFLELAGALVVLSYSYAYVPSIAKNSAVFLRRAAVVFISPSFVFLLGNAIVIILFAKSGQIGSESEPVAARSGVEGSGEKSADLSFPAPTHSGEAEEVVYEDKEVCVVIRARAQSQSEELENPSEKPVTQRSDELTCEAASLFPPPPAAKFPAKGVAAQDNNKLDAESDEDAEQFRRTVEEFIAKQQWFQRQESLSLVSYSAGLPEPVAV